MSSKLARPNRLQAWLTLHRPANVITAAADVAAGAAIAGFYSKEAHWPTLFALIAAGMAFYAGGVVLNDYFDRKLDAVERPERPIPSGVVPAPFALATGLFWLGIGTVLVAATGVVLSAYAALALLVAILVYDAFAKRSAIFGPLVMGSCRSLNLAMGVLILDKVPPDGPIMLWVPLIYVACITLISRGEVNSNGKAPLIAGLLGYVLVLGILASRYYVNGVYNNYGPMVGLIPYLFIGFWIATSWVPLIDAIRSPEAGLIRKAVKHAVLGMIPLNSIIMMLYVNWLLGLLLLALFPLSRWVAKSLAVT